MRSTWLLLLFLPVVIGCPGSTSGSPGVGTSAPALPVKLSCVDSVQERVLPGWATTGFGRPEAPVATVLGARGDILGVLFGHPLHAPEPAEGRANKILWVANPDAVADPDAAAGKLPGSLLIEAALQGSEFRVVREVPLGPSYVDLPRAGCWIFTLSWGGHRDRLAIPYEPYEPYEPARAEP